MLALGVLALSCGPGLARAAEFQPVVKWGCVSGGSFYKIQFGNTDLSAEGRTIVSRAHSGNGWCEAFRWSADTGQIEWLGHYDPIEPDEDHPSPWSMACATSADGSIVAGSSLTGHYHPLGIGYEVQLISGFRWENGTFTHLPRWMYTHHAYPLDMTADGSVAVGALWEDEFRLYYMVEWVHAVRWVDGWPEDLGSLPLSPIFNDDDAFALAVSADGSVIVGQSGEIHDYWRPFVWINGEMYPLQTLSSSSCPEFWTPDDNFSYISCNAVVGVSGDGSVAVGHLYDGANVVPIRWDTATQAPGPLPLLGDDAWGAADAASHDGSMIVGTSGGRGAVWLESFGYSPISLETLLRSVRLGDDIAGWDLGVSMVSADGKDIAGLGINPEGQLWLWHADLRNPQPNDACAFAQWLGGGPVADTRVKTTLGSLRDATVDGASACEFEHGPDVWYSFSAPVDGYLYLETCGTTSQPNPVQTLDLSVHDAPCPGGGATTVYCADDCAGPPCEGTLPCIRPEHVRIAAGRDYLIRVAKKAGDTSPGVDFELRTQFLPDTDECDDAFIVDVPGPNEEAVLTLGTTTHATVESTPVCDQVRQEGPGVWYKVLGTGRIIVADTLDWTGYDTKLSVFCGGCGGLNCVTANDDYHYPEVLGSSVSWCSQWGAVYHILVHGDAPPLSRNFGLKLWDGGSCTPSAGACAPPNDSCEDALHIAPGAPAEIIGDNTGATWDTTASCSASYDDVWYRYRAACEGVVLIDTCQPDIGSLHQTVLSVYDACGGTELDCDFDPTAPCLGRSTVSAQTTVGQDFWIRVANLSADSALDGTFPLRIQETPAPLSLSSVALPDATQGQHYEAVIPIAGGCPPYEVEAELPRGLRFIRFAAIFGTPEVSGDFVIPIAVHDQSGDPPGQFTVTLRVLPSNDDCVQAIPVTEGGIPFGNIEATTDGPDEPFGCNFSGYTHVESDIWFCYTSSCEGRATVSLCDSEYDTKVAVYSSCRCGAALGGLLACDDDGCGLQSQVTFEVHEGWDYAIRIGGYGGAQGNGQLAVTCVNKPACCLPDGTCDQLWPEDCVALGGVEQEARATCDVLLCPSSSQACCLRDGSCQDLSPDTCWDQFGFPQGGGTTCAATTCSQPQACCFDDGTCGGLPPEECSGLGGSPQGSGTTCETVNCPQPQKACCFADGSCQDLASATCLDQSGIPQGADTTCATITCPQPEACCFDDGHCEDLLAAQCSGGGGVAQGVGTTCAGTNCPQPPAACCFADMSCQDLPPNECIAQGGMPQYGSLCDNVDCTVLLGACCFEDGSCQDLLQADCFAQGGITYAPDATCATHTCAQPEACCFSDGSCEDYTVANCLRRRGEPGGPGSACGIDCNGDLFDDACQVLGDANHSGAVDLDDWLKMVDCLTSAGAPVGEQTCRPCILDCDDDVDLHDLAVFQRAFGMY